MVENHNPENIEMVEIPIDQQGQIIGYATITPEQKRIWEAMLWGEVDCTPTDQITTQKEEA